MNEITGLDQELQLIEDINKMAAAIAASLPEARVVSMFGDASRALVRTPAGGATRVLVRLALLADCLRVAHRTMSADGRITDEELDAAFQVLYLASQNFARSLRGYEAFRDLEPGSARDLLAAYERDAAPFGFKNTITEWLGLELCRATALAGDGEPLEIYKQMALRLFDQIGTIDGTSTGETSARREISRLIDKRARLEREPDVDLRLQSFLSGKAKVFSAVAQAHSMSERDPFDVEQIHAEAREAFAALIERATTPIRHDHGRMLLVLGDSGSGKTHLLRALRSHVHGRRLGYASYVQLQSRSDDYARYLVGGLVDSLEQPYDRPADRRSGLLLLSNGLSDLLGVERRDEIARLEQDDWEDRGALASFIEGLVDDLLSLDDFSGFDPDFLRVMLHVQTCDPRTMARVVKYLRCEDMNRTDREYLGDVVPRTSPDDPIRMVEQLGRLAWTTQGGALVFLLDQIEDTSYGVDGTLAFLRATDTLRRLTDQLPSAVGVISCLDDLYRVVRPKLNQAALDRLERDPVSQRLRATCGFDEINAIVTHRLEALYEQTGARHRDDDPLYPIPTEALRQLDNRRLRDVLDYCHRFREDCIAEGSLVAITDGPAQPEKPPEPDRSLDSLDIAWNDARSSSREVSEEDPGILALLASAAAVTGHELGLNGKVRGRVDGGLLVYDVEGTVAAAIGVANRAYQGGRFAAQVRSVRDKARDRLAVVIRTSEFPNGTSSLEVISQLRQAGGRNVVVTPSDLRHIAAMQEFKRVQSGEVFETWLRSRKPLSALPSLREIFELDRLREQEPEVQATQRTRTPTAPLALVPTPPVAVMPVAPTTTQPIAIHELANFDGPIRIGNTAALRPERVDLPVELLCRHAAILGTSGSGKTTTALAIIEQLLERGIPAILVDRKGDLAGYARDLWWSEPGVDEAATRRKRALRERVDVRLFTPGSRGGRPLALSAVPNLDGVPTHERYLMVQHAATALAAMAGISLKTGPQLAILTKAVEILAESGGHHDMNDLVQLIHSHDDGLVAKVPLFDDRAFKRLVEALEAVRISNEDLFDGQCEQLTADVLLGPSPSGKVALSIVNTRFLQNEGRIQLWTARLMGELSRFAARRPSRSLQAVVMFDEADVYLPAGASKPPTKEPMQDLLKRARSGGLGIMLATQSPGDLDYRVRDLVTTWFVGKVGDKLSISKMRPLFETHPTIAGKLGRLGMGQFFMMSEPGIREVKVTPSLLHTEQLGMTDILDLARDRANNGS